MRKEITERAKSLVSVVKKIEDWCNKNVEDGDIKVYNLIDRHEVFGWFSWVYSTKYKKLYLANGDHSRWGANYGDFKTGMTESNFDYYMFSGTDKVEMDYAMINEDGNLVFEEKIQYLMRNWNSIKEKLISIGGETQKFASFEA